METTSLAVLILIDSGFDEIEAMYPKYRLLEDGYRVFMTAPVAKEKYIGRHGYPCVSDLSVYDVHERHYAGVILPGGWAPAKLRTEGKVKSLVNAFFHSGKLVGSICHGGSVAISAGICAGLHMTGSPAILDDLRNAGANVEDAAVIVDRNVVTSRTTADLPEFMIGVLGVLGKTSTSLREAAIESHT